MDNNPVMSYLLARKKSTGSLCSKRSDSELPTESLNTKRPEISRGKERSIPRYTLSYEVLLSTKDNFTDKDNLGIIEKGKMLVRKLLNQKQ